MNNFKKIIKIPEDKVPIVTRLIKKAKKANDYIDIKIEKAETRILKGTYSNKEIQLYDVIIKNISSDSFDNRVVGKVEVTGIGDNIVKTNSGVDIDRSIYKSSKITCEACKSNRHRVKLFLVMDSNGIVKTIGRNCLKDILKVQSLNHYLKMIEAGFKLYDELLNEEFFLDDELFEFNKTQTGNLFLNIESVLAYIRDYLKDNPYVKKISYYERDYNHYLRGLGETVDEKTSTSDYFKKKFSYIDSIELNDLTVNKKEGIRDDIDLFLEHCKEENEFHEILKNILLENKYVKRTEAHLLSSFFITTEIIKKEIELKKMKTYSNHIGNIKDKIELDVIFSHVVTIGHQFGLSNIYFFKNGYNTLVWKTATSIEVEKDKSYHLKATIKAHSIYDNEKQTNIVRVKLNEI